MECIYFLLLKVFFLSTNIGFLVSYIACYTLAFVVGVI